MVQALEKCIEYCSLHSPEGDFLLKEIERAYFRLDKQGKDELANYMVDLQAQLTIRAKYGWLEKIRLSEVRGAVIDYLYKLENVENVDDDLFDWIKSLPEIQRKLLEVYDGVALREFSEAPNLMRRNEICKLSLRPMNAILKDPPENTLELLEYLPLFRTIIDDLIYFGILTEKYMNWVSTNYVPLLELNRGLVLTVRMILEELVGSEDDENPNRIEYFTERWDSDRISKSIESSSSGNDDIYTQYIKLVLNTKDLSQMDMTDMKRDWGSHPIYMLEKRLVIAEDCDLLSSYHPPLHLSHLDEIFVRLDKVRLNFSDDRLLLLALMRLQEALETWSEEDGSELSYEEYMNIIREVEFKLKLFSDAKVLSSSHLLLGKKYLDDAKPKLRAFMVKGGKAT